MDDSVRISVTVPEDKARDLFVEWAKNELSSLLYYSSRDIMVATVEGRTVTFAPRADVPLSPDAPVPCVAPDGIYGPAEVVEF